MTRHSRTVYDIITLVSEVSGFADLLIVMTTMIYSFLFSLPMLESEIIKQLGLVIVKKTKKKHLIDDSLSKPYLLQLLKQV
jgi:hypothetical protein